MACLSEFNKKVLHAFFYVSFLTLCCAGGKSAAQDNSMRTKHAVAALRQTHINAEEIYQRAEMFLSRKEYPEAIAVLKSGLSLVGDSYFSRDLEDDTGMRLMLAQLEENKGNLERSASYLRTVLRDRLDLLQERIHAE